MILAAALALAAALLVGSSAVLQQSAAAGVSTRGAGFFTTLVRRPRWLAGAGADTAGFAVLLAARAVGPLLLVQPLMATSVLIALLLGARGRPRPAVLGWGALLAGALAVFVLLGRPERGVARASPGTWLPWLVGLGALVALVLLAARRSPRRRARAVGYGGCAALFFGLGAALTTTVVALVPAGVPALLSAWETWLAAAVLLAGTAAQQLAYRAGPLPVSLPVVAAGEPLVAATLGVAVYGESLRGGGALVVLAVVAMVVAVVALARRR